MKIVFMGTPEFSQSILELLNRKYEVVLVVSQPDKKQGRKNILTPPPVKQTAIALNIPVFQPEHIKDDYQEIIDYKADVLVTAAYGQIVPTKLLDSFKYCVNVHASLLPKYRGGAPIQRSIINGDEYSGVSLMQMVKRMDAGVVYAQEKMLIDDSFNNTILFEKLSQLGTSMVDKYLDDIVSGKIEGIPQNEDLVVYAPNISKEEEILSFCDTSRNIFNKIRGLANEPGVYALINGTKIKIYESKIVNCDNLNVNSGTVISLDKHFVVKTNDGAIELLKIKPENKGLMDAKSFLNGQKIIKINDKFNE